MDDFGSHWHRCGALCIKGNITEFIKVKKRSKPKIRRRVGKKNHFMKFLNLIKKRVFLTLKIQIWVLSFSCFGQNQTLDRLNASKMNDGILFNLETTTQGKKLTYLIDPKPEDLNGVNTSRTKLPVDNSKGIFLASNSSSFNILFAFLNPLRFRHRIQATENEDQSSLSFEKFYESLFSLAKTVNFGMPQNTNSQLSISSAITNIYEQHDLSRAFDTYTAAKAKAINKDIVRIKSDELIDWTLWYYNTYFEMRAGKLNAKLGIDTTNLSNLRGLVDNFIKAEKYLYDKMDDDYAKSFGLSKDAKVYFESHMANILELLSKESTLESFKGRIAKIEDDLKLLKAYNDKAADFCKLIENVILTYKGSQVENYFIDYTKNKISTYLQNVRSTIGNRNSLIDNFNALISEIRTDYLNKTASGNTTKEAIQITKLGITYRLSVQLVESDFEIKNGSVKRKEDIIYNFELTVNEYTSMIAEFGLGTIFFPIVDANIFSSSNGVVTKTTSKLYFTPMASLNLIPNIGKGQAFWMIQLGVGSNVDKPTIALGTGVRFYNVRESTFKNFSITVGAVGCFTRKLNTLTEGSSATQATLEADLFYSPEFRPYIGFQLNF
jgi:hypothetical protein